MYIPFSTLFRVRADSLERGGRETILLAQMWGGQAMDLHEREGGVMA